MRDVADLADRVDGAGVDVADLRADDDRPFQAGQGALQFGGDHAALVVDRHVADAGGAEAEVAGGQVDGHVVLGAGDDGHVGRAAQALALHVPAGLGEEFVAGGGQRGQVGHGAAGGEADGGVRGQAQEFQDPLRGDVLGDGDGR